MNIHLANESTPTMDPVIISNNMNARLLYGIIMDSSHVSVLQLPGLKKKLDKFTFPPK